MSDFKSPDETADYTGGNAQVSQLLGMVERLRNSISTLTTENAKLSTEITELAARLEQAQRNVESVDRLFEAALHDLEMKTATIEDLERRCGRIRELERLVQQRGPVAFASLDDEFKRLEDAHDAWVLFLRFRGIDASDPSTLAEFDAWLKTELPEDGERISQTFSQRFQAARETQQSSPEDPLPGPISSLPPPSPTLQPPPPPFPRAAPPPRLNPTPRSVGQPPTSKPTPSPRREDGRYSHVDENDPLLADARLVAFHHLHSSKAPDTAEPPPSAHPNARDSVDDGAITIEPAPEADPDHPGDTDRDTAEYPPFTLDTARIVH